MSNQLKLCFIHYRPDSGSHETIAGAVGEDLDAIANAFGMWRHDTLMMHSETDQSLRMRVSKVLDTYYEAIPRRDQHARNA